MLVDEGLLERRNGGWEAAADLAEATDPADPAELLGARLDRMPGGERAALERGAVEGQLFHRGAVVDALRDGRARARCPISSRRSCGRSSSARRRPASPTRARFASGTSSSATPRTTALPKKLRADLHERFADWLEEKVGERA